MSCVRNFNECNCNCHTSQFAVRHFMACCHTCKICDKRIKMFYYTDHYKECKAQLVERLTDDLPGPMSDEEMENAIKLYIMARSLLPKR